MTDEDDIVVRSASLARLALEKIGEAKGLLRQAEEYADQIPGPAGLYTRAALSHLESADAALSVSADRVY